MKKTIGKLMLLIALLGTKIVLSGFTCPASGFQINYPIGKPFEITIEAKSPCFGFNKEYYKGRDAWDLVNCPANNPANAYFDVFCYSKGLIGC